MSGGIITVNGNIVKSWARIRAVRALSSAESEFYALVKAIAETLGIITILKERRFGEMQGQM